MNSTIWGRKLFRCPITWARHQPTRSYFENSAHRLELRPAPNLRWHLGSSRGETAELRREKKLTQSAGSHSPASTQQLSSLTSESRLGRHWKHQTSHKHRSQSDESVCGLFPQRRLPSRQRTGSHPAGFHTFSFDSITSRTPRLRMPVGCCLATDPVSNKSWDQTQGDSVAIDGSPIEKGSK